MYTSIDSMMRRYERLARQHRADLTDREAFKAWQDEARARLEDIVRGLWENTHPKVHIDRPYV